MLSSIPALLSLLLASAAPYAHSPKPTDCPIVEVKLQTRGGCRDQGTADWADDEFRGHIEVAFRELPAAGELRLEGRHLLETPTVSVETLEAGATSFTFPAVRMRATPRPARLTLSAAFTAIPGCTFTQQKAGRTREQCSVCPGPKGTTGGRYPDCWPTEIEGQPCTQAVNYAPDPDYPELTPVRYMQAIVHVFQKEHPDSLGQWARHPDDPGNFTEAHIDIIRSWFNAPEGANGLLSNLCDDPTDRSPHMRDARVRLLNTGTVGKDVFFHPDNKGWGIGYSGCQPGGYRYWYQVDNRYLKSPDPSHPNYTALVAPETQHAFHIFITGGKWMAQPPGNPEIPDENDCYWPCGGGLTASMGCQNGAVPDYPAQALFGTYNIWQHGNTPGEQTCEADYPGSDAGLGENLLGEIFHVLSLDHISPLQAHKKHPDGGDGCPDTPWQSDYNRLGCNFQKRCALTECQIGRMHHFFTELQPDFERFPDGKGGFQMSPNPCAPTEAPVTLPEGANLVWSSLRSLRSDLVVAPGATLRLQCRLRLPAGARITVKAGGTLIIDGARVYTDCGEAPWAGFWVEGQLSIEPGSVIERADQFVLSGAGQANAKQTRFLDCGFPEGLFCGQDGNSCF